MTNSEQLTQQPAPGTRYVKFCGDTVVFRLIVEPPQWGCAYLRTNLGHADVTRREIIRHVEHNEPRLGRDWFDLPMQQTAPGHYEICLGLFEVGHFEAKCLFVPEARAGDPLWPSGPNTVINAEPAATCSGNLIYNAFVRQFGSHDSGATRSDPLREASIRNLDSAGYTVIPPSGTFRDLIGRLDFIIGALGCRWLQLLPVHPTPTTYGRMGRFGSPYAALSFTEVDPALAVFDPKATPLEQFLELVDAVHCRGGRLLLDIAINHTGWAARLHESHPQWLARGDAGEILNPGAWGVVWEDLTHLDYSHKGLWCYMADVLLTWCRRGVDGFRCDAGYMIPADAWQYMIAKVRDQFPETIFFLEGLGGKISVTRDLLNRANFNWAYSELFQNYDRGQIEHYLPESIDISATDGITVHFAETHDNNRLAATSIPYARLRTALCALLSPNGAFAFANGLEWFATEKINVHDACSLNWGAAENQTAEIAALGRLLKSHPVFGPDTRLKIVSRETGNFIAVRRHHRPSGSIVLVVANLDWQHPVTASWDSACFPWRQPGPVDLLSGRSLSVVQADSLHRIALEPGQVLCLADAADSSGAAQQLDAAPDPLMRQRLQAKAIDVLTHCTAAIPEDLSEVTTALADDPETFCRRLNRETEESRVVVWQYPDDVDRHVMLPPGFFLLLRSDHPFNVRLMDKERTLAVEESLSDSHGGAFILLRPRWSSKAHERITIQMHLFGPQRPRHAESQLLLLGSDTRPTVQTTFSRQDCYQRPLLALDTDGRGAMLRAHSDWRLLTSRYDALLAANPDPAVPGDRRVLLTRCRAWIVFQGFSHAIGLDCLKRFSFDYDQGAVWHYEIPTGQGEHIGLVIALRLAKDRANTMVLDISRRHSHARAAELDDHHAVQVILRPDIEDRNFHDTTKAFTGPEREWPGAVKPRQNGFTFAPAGGVGLCAEVSRGRFVYEPEWHYMVHRAREAERGLDPDSDLFSPGYFSGFLAGGQALCMTAGALSGQPSDGRMPTEPASPPRPGKPLALETALIRALEHYVVRRGAYRTVIAGFPWFLDWGRDTLIVARGLVAAGMLDTARAIVMQFCRFEEQGTLPNMIHGDNASNRDTSDAPLWLFTVCADMVRAMGDQTFLDTVCDARTIRQILVDMAAAMATGLPNGVCMDPDTGLIFSPAHFTWMDTNHPACTPRQGYPVEIQALWYAALVFLVQVDPPRRERWQTLARQVKATVAERFWDPQLGHLVDCLHCRPGQRASQAVADDALRPNQLLAITLGAVTDQAICRRILTACQSLLVPGAIRSLANRPVQTPLAIYHHDALLNDPASPYWGRYRGDEDTRRKPAYHNGTAWTWPFPSFCEAWAITYGPGAVPAAKAWLSSATELINGHCAGHVPEIVDGDAPHAQRGCDAQAWGVSELLRVWRRLSGTGKRTSGKKSIAKSE